MKKLQTAALVALGSLSTLAQANRAVLLDVSVQIAGSTKNFTYNSSPMIPIGELSRLPIKSAAVLEGEFELQINSALPKINDGKNLIEIQLELFQNRSGEAPRSLGVAKVTTRIHESAATEQTKPDGSKILFTVTPLEIQNP